MASLLKDLWFYVSLAGFLTSAALFFVFLFQYRCASEEPIAPENADETAPVLPQPQQPVIVPVSEAPQAEPLSSVAAAAEEPTGQIERLNREVSALKEMARRHEAQGEEALKLLTQLADRMATSWTAIKIEANGKSPASAHEEFHAAPAESDLKDSSAPIADVVAAPAPQGKPSEIVQEEEPVPARKGPIWPV